MPPPVRLQPPARAELVHLSAVERPRLLVVVDTEEEFDWSQPFDRAHTATAHMRDLAPFQALCDEFGVRPVYVVDYPVATQREGIETLGPIQAAGRCEIGAHLHPWVTPPFEEEVNAHNSYPGNLPRDLERAKLAALAQAIEHNLGVRPKSYKAGRYGFGPNTPAILRELGFECDLSWCPGFDLSADGGPDYARFSSQPAWLEGGTLLEIPTTGAFVGFARGAPGLHALAGRPLGARLRARGLLARLGALERLHLSPEGYGPADNQRLTRALLAQGQRCFTFALHSPSLRPGCTPYVRTREELDRFLASIRRYMQFFFGELAGVNVTAAELHHSLRPHPRDRT